MLIGILSDTHDRAEAAAAGLRALEGAGCEIFLHCGDVGGQRVIDLLAGLKGGFVWGNTDFDRGPLLQYARALGVKCYGVFGDLSLGGKRVALLHGDDAKLKQRIVAEQQFDYLCQGHTHVPEDRRVGRTRIINPGALHRASEKTVAVLDTEVDRVEFLALKAVV